MKARSGQAITEFVVGIIAVLVITACLVQIGVMSKIHTDVMSSAREKAGYLAIAPPLLPPAADYLAKWDNGADKVNYSVDDASSPGDIGDFKARMVAYAHPADLESKVGPNKISNLDGIPLGVMDGLVEGHDSETVPLLPAVKDLVYAADWIKVESVVWMTSGVGLY